MDQRNATRVGIEMNSGGEFLGSVLLLCTSRCNLRCRMCHYSTGKGSDLPLPSIQRLARELVVAGISTVYLSGGEPLLRKDFGDVVESLLETGLYVRLSTNGTLVTKRRVTELRGICDISISLDGMKACHDGIRGGANTFERARRGITTILNHLPDTRLCVSITVLPDNAEHIEELIDFAFSMGVHAVGLQPPVVSFFPESIRQHVLQDETSRKQMAAVFSRLKATSRCSLDNTSRFYHLAQEYISSGFVVNASCSAGRQIVTVFADGRVGPCWGLPSEASIIEHSFQEALFDETMKEATRQAAAKSCPGCLFYCFYFPETHPQISFNR